MAVTVLQRSKYKQQNNTYTKQQQKNITHANMYHYTCNYIQLNNTFTKQEHIKQHQYTQQDNIYINNTQQTYI